MSTDQITPDTEQSINDMLNEIAHGLAEKLHSDIVQSCAEDTETPEQRMKRERNKQCIMRN